MAMGVVHVGGVWVDVSHWRMFMKMRVRLAGWIESTMGMAMMFGLHMRMRLAHRTMEVLMFMTLSQMQPHAHCH
jgi:hypothetical protein